MARDSGDFINHQVSCLIYTHGVCNCWPDFGVSSRRTKKKASRTGRRKRSRMIRLAAIQGGWHCHYCKKSLTPIFDPDNKVSPKDPNRPTIDHVRPVSKGGPTYHIDNQVLSCATCNEEKGDTYEQD